MLILIKTWETLPTRMPFFSRWSGRNLPSMGIRDTTQLFHVVVFLGGNQKCKACFHGNLSKIIQTLRS